MPFLPPERRAVYGTNIEDALPRAWLGDDQVIGEAELGERQPGAVGEGVGPEGGGGGSSENGNIVQPFPQLACSVNIDIFRLEYILILNQKMIFMLIFQSIITEIFRKSIWSITYDNALI